MARTFPVIIDVETKHRSSNFCSLSERRSFRHNQTDARNTQRAFLKSGASYTIFRRACVKSGRGEDASSISINHLSTSVSRSRSAIYSLMLFDWSPPPSDGLVRADCRDREYRGLFLLSHYHRQHRTEHWRVLAEKAKLNLPLGSRAIKTLTSTSHISKRKA